VIQENAPDHSGGDGEKVGAVPPLDSILVDQAKVRFVYQRGTLQRRRAGLETKVPAGDAAQFLVHQGHQTVERAAVPLAPIH